jgi:tetratricopeptide (TPR) repeat protein
MDLMKNISILAKLFVSVAISSGSLVTFTGATAFAEDRAAAPKLTVQNWSEDFAASLKGKAKSKAKSTEALTDFAALDKKLFSKCSECENKTKMESARKLFAKGQYAEARALYNQIDKASSYWLQAVEERAWTYFRENNFDDALAQAKTLLAPQFASYVDSEAYFLQALTSLKTCNYKNVFETTAAFKEKQKPRLVEIQNLSSSGTNPALTTALDKVQSFPIVFKELGDSVKLLPQLFYKDVEMQKQILRYKLADTGLKKLAEKKTGNFVALTEKLEKTRSASLDAMKTRLQKLATEETNDNVKVVQKLNLVEVEAIQRLHADVDLDKKLFVKGDYKKTTSDQLVFLDDGRPWIDELDKYEVRAKACPQNIRRKM